MGIANNEAARPGIIRAGLLLCRRLSKQSNHYFTRSLIVDLKGYQVALQS